MPNLLGKAIAIAVKAHKGQDDLPGQAYILHPMRVLDAVSASDDARQNEPLQCVAALHDVIERADVSADQLRKAGMPAVVVRAVERLTHREPTTYADYVIQLKPDKLARAVKIADLLDNADLRRVTFRPDKLDKDVARLVRYATSYQFLTDQIDERTYRRVMTATQPKG
jgi:(p)ppGpp synthase/HD superfamily hydrolase